MKGQASSRSAVRVADRVRFSRKCLTGYFSCEVPVIPKGTEGRVMHIDRNGVVFISFRAPRFEGSLPIEARALVDINDIGKGRMVELLE